jgi:hypothetical protein
MTKIISGTSTIRGVAVARYRSVITSVVDTGMTLVACEPFRGPRAQHMVTFATDKERVASEDSMLRNQLKETICLHFVALMINTTNL